MAGFTAFKRDPGQGAKERPPGKTQTPETKRIALANRLIDHGNYLCYGMAGAALWALGIPPHLSLFHGKTRAGGLVFDVADAFKDAFVLPLAFHAAVIPKVDDREQFFRGKLINAFDDKAVGAVELG